MTVSGITSTSYLQQLRQAGGKAAQQATPSASDKSSGSAAYQLSLSQQAQQMLLQYGDMGAEVHRAEDALAGVDLGGLAHDGAGNMLGATHTVEVKQLAEGQVLSTMAEADRDSTSLGTGTLTFQFGTDDAAGGFTPDSDAVDVKVTDGSLDGIAKAVNDADFGIAASVVQDADGQYRLEFKGPNGAANAFSVSGIDALAHDPSSAFSSGMTVQQSAQDAVFSVDGGPEQTSIGNAVQIAPGVTHTLTAVGTDTVAVAFGQDRAETAAHTVVDTLNGLMASLGGDIGKQLGQDGLGLDAIGITVADDGSLAIDQAKLEGAYTADPQGTTDKLAGVLDAARQALEAEGSTIQSKMPSLVTALMNRTPMSLLDYLDGGNGSNQQSQSTLQSLLDGGLGASVGAEG
jgi:flagellar capping protein FliD